MTEQQHPITPPPELVQQWRKSGPADAAVNNAYEQHIATQAARWGANQELEACCDSLQELWAPSDWITSLRAKRRPKPPSLKEQALRHVGVIQDNWTLLGDGEHASPSLTGQITYKQLQDIRSALEALDDND